MRYLLVKEREVETVLFVPCTWKGILARTIQEIDNKYIEESHQGRLRVVKEKGRTLKDILVNKDPWGGEKCSRKDFFPCTTQSKEAGRCKWTPS